MSTLTPTWTDNVSIVAATNLARGSKSRTSFNWASKLGGYLFIRIGRQGTTGLTNGVDVLVRRTFNSDGTVHPGPIFQALSLTAAASRTTVNVDSNSGGNVLNVASITGFAAGDYIYTVDTSYTPARVEFHRISKTAAGVITLDSNLKISHTSAQGDYVTNKCDAWTVWLEGGATYEVIFDYGDDSAGESVTIEVLAQTLDSYSSS